MERTIKVWDPLVRLLHWSLAVGFAIAWLTADVWDALHEWTGYATAAIVAIRLAWGLIGTKYARFAQFVRPPAAVAGYLGATLRGREPRYVGHNPAGAAMIVALLSATAATALTGWMTTLDVFWRHEWIEDVHEATATLMLILAVVHVGGVIVASLRHRENLARAMVTGRKRAPGTADVF